MKNIVLCFDHAQEQLQLRDASNARALFRLLDATSGQLNWYHPGTVAAPARIGERISPRQRRRHIVEQARATVVEAYEFLAGTYEPGDDIYLFGAGRGASCARELVRLLGVLGLPTDHHDDLLDYLLAVFALPRTRRTGEDWQRVGALAAGLAGGSEIAVPVRFVGLFDMVRVPGVASTTGPLANVAEGRHAVAIDGGPFGERVDSPAVDEVWFRGAHCDVAGVQGACWPLADIALDWVLDGAVHAGLAVRDGGRNRVPAPCVADPLAGSAHMLSLRRVPLDAAVHASVEVYLRSHPQYWRRLPARFGWADREWLARGERLVPTAAPAATPAEATASQPVDAELLTA
ncbi:phospholipase effector Tle1 domain-containing protein [Mycobacterium sp. NPDC050041]|uniref:phospholipase effector Tle1 domain-containing protein n=1 Tax=Mycobacterium sp. NPDC050041 TaxID=3364293 RepID=UPI003C2F7FE3